ncbi:MAG: phage tail tube protein [Symbiobacteriaceae bacterium]|nr:phage tail tube protein [Symbiobacteriaceae bacterium]
MATIFLKADELVNGRKGSVYFTRKGRRKEIAGVQSITANRNLSTTTFVTVGTIRKQNRITGVEGNGTMSLNYWLVKEINEMVDEYETTGVFPEWDIMVVNEQAGATLGNQTVQLFGCQLSGTVPLAMLNAASDDGMTFDINFSFDNSENLESFNDPQRVGREG